MMAIDIFSVASTALAGASVGASATTAVAVLAWRYATRKGPEYILRALSAHAPWRVAIRAVCKDLRESDAEDTQP